MLIAVSPAALASRRSLAKPGLGNREIGARLEISESAVKSSLQQIFNKLGVRTRAQVVKIALEQYRDQL